MNTLDIFRGTKIWGHRSFYCMQKTSIQRRGKLVHIVACVQTLRLAFAQPGGAACSITLQL